MTVRRMAALLLTTLLTLSVTTALSSTTAHAADRLTAQQAKKCDQARAKVRAKTQRVVRLRQAGARPVRVRAAKKARRAATRAAVRRCTPAPPAPVPPRRYLTAPVIIGDSMTVGATPALQALRPKLFVNAKWGLGVNQLPVRIREMQEKYIFQPSVVVVALGTNEQAGWSKEAYQAPLDLLPPGQRVVFVNTWRPFAGIGTPEDGVLYSGWMAEIAAERPRTVVADWRSVASARPELLRDGIHQSHGEGHQVWAELVNAAIGSVLQQP